MKTISLWIIVLIFPFLLISCSTDEFTVEPEAKATTINEPVSKQSLLLPQNNANVYDTIGRIQNHVLEIYLSANHNHSTIEEINDEIQLLVNNYGNTTTENTVLEPSPVTLIMDIINSPESSLNTIIANSYLTNNAKISLTDFVYSLMLLKEEEYEDIYIFIVMYESSIIENILLSIEDKEIILTISSLARYSLYFSSERKDKDWEISIGNIAAGIRGALENSLTAVSMTLVTGISETTLVFD